MNLADRVAIEISSNDVAAGTTAVNGTEVDMQGFDGVVFVAKLGAVTATGVPSLKAQQSAASGSGYADLAGTSVVGDDESDDKCLVLDLYRPRERYVRCVLTRATANVVVDSILAIKYRGAKLPTSLGAGEDVREIHASPAEGTA